MLSIVPYKAHSLLIVRISSIDISRARVSQGTEPTRVWYAHHTGSMDMIIIEWLHAAIPYFFWAWSHGTSSRAGWGCMARSPNVTHFIKFEWNGKITLTGTLICCILCIWTRPPGSDSHDTSRLPIDSDDKIARYAITNYAPLINMLRHCNIGSYKSAKMPHST